MSKKTFHRYEPSKRKPHNQNLGYVAERRCPWGGHIVIYDRERGFDCDASERWIVMHEPSSLHVAVRTKALAYEVMKNPDLDVFGGLVYYILPSVWLGKSKGG